MAKMSSLLFLSILLYVVASIEIASVEIKSCPACKLNSMPKLKRVLKHEVADYSNIKMTWIRGHVPTAYFLDSEGKQLINAPLPNAAHGEVLKFFKGHGFVPTRTAASLPVFGAPKINGTFNGHFYEFFETEASYQDAKEFAATRSFAEKPGHNLVLNSEAEETFIYSLLQDVMPKSAAGVWLAASYKSDDKSWRWSEGPEKDRVFGEGQNSGAVNGAYTHWKKDEPNNSNKEQDEFCVFLASENGSGWEDCSCYIPIRRSIVVEYGEASGAPPPPVVVAAADGFPLPDESVLPAGTVPPYSSRYFLIVLSIVVFIALYLWRQRRSEDKSRKT